MGAGAPGGGDTGTGGTRGEGPGRPGRRRVPVRSPRASGARRRARPAAPGGAVARGGLGAPARGPGEGAARVLIRAQLRTALSTCGIALAVIAGLPLLPLVVPRLSRVRPWGVPLAWM